MNPEKLNKLSQSVISIYNEIETEMLVNIAKRLKANKNVLDTDPVSWQLQRLNNMGLLDRDNIKIIRDKAGLASREMNKIILSVGLDGLEVNENILNKALKKGAHLVKPDDPVKSPKMLEILGAYERQANNVLNLTNQTMLDKSKTIYRDIINKTAADVITGNLTGEQALRKTVRAWAEKGVPALIDRAGREWGAEGYIRTVLMSTSNNVVNELQDMRLDEWGVDLVEISSHEGNRPGCEPYAGRIFSLKEGHPKYPFLYDPEIGRIGDPDSLFGINCGHVKYAFVEGISKQQFHPNNKEKNKEVYDQSQQQRSIERSIRKAKTQERMFEALGDSEGMEQAKSLVKERQGRMRAFIDETGRTRRRVREQIH